MNTITNNNQGRVMIWDIAAAIEPQYEDGLGLDEMGLINLGQPVANTDQENSRVAPDFDAEISRFRENMNTQAREAGGMERMLALEPREAITPPVRNQVSEHLSINCNPENGVMEFLTPVEQSWTNSIQRRVRQMIWDDLGHEATPNAHAQLTLELTEGQVTGVDIIRYNNSFENPQEREALQAIAHNLGSLGFTDNSVNGQMTVEIEASDQGLINIYTREIVS